jgi:hypothetical protein
MFVKPLIPLGYEGYYYCIELIDILLFYCEDEGIMESELELELSLKLLFMYVSMTGVFLS